MGFIWFYVALCILQGSTMFYQDTGVSCCDELSFCNLRKLVIRQKRTLGLKISLAPACASIDL